MKEDKNSYKPEWAPEEENEAFASRVVKGNSQVKDGVDSPSPLNPSLPAGKRRRLSPEELEAGILKGDRTILGRAITLVESNSLQHMQQAQTLLQRLLPHTGRSVRIGVSGVPGAGKSTLIEALGVKLVKEGHKVAVLAIDPSSQISGGSILGDKTRMENLSRLPQSFIRPSPSGGTLGGVARKTRETILLCEAAGFDVILVETVGVGQSETTVRSMVDFFLLVQLPGGGDELQGIKKGVMEICDAVVVNKADGDNKPRAEASRQEYAMALHYLAPATPGWATPALTCSAISGEGIDKIWEVVQKFVQVTRQNGVFNKRRKEQIRDWLTALVNEQLQQLFYNHPLVRQQLPNIEAKVLAGQMPPTAAAQKLLELFQKETD